MNRKIAVSLVAGALALVGITAGIAEASSGNTYVQTSPALCVNMHTGAVNAYGYGKCPAYPGSEFVVVPVTATVTATPAPTSTGNTVAVQRPADQVNKATDVVGLQVTGTDSAANQVLAFKATGLPPGLNISSAGLISGTISCSTTETVYKPVVTAVDTTGVSASVSFTWTVTPVTSCAV